MLKRTTLLTAYQNVQSSAVCNLPASQVCPSSTTSSSHSNHGGTRAHFAASTRPRLTSRPQSDSTSILLPNPQIIFHTQPSRRRASQCQLRQYATVRSDGKSSSDYFRDNMNWPCRRSSKSSTVAPVPTPYEIFDLERNAVYSKQKYYELVKLYHPDRHGHQHRQSTSGELRDSARDDGMISPIERLNRYRLVVQAHEILSDPVKRKAYDNFGLGWEEAHHRNTATRHTRGYTNANGQSYGYGPDYDNSVFGNATWEDWERYYRKRDGREKQQYAGTYINPNAFASFVIILAVLAGVMQATRAGQLSSEFTERSHAFTEETHQFMNDRAQHLTDQGLTTSTDGRIKHFLERRDPSRYGLKDEEEEMYRKHFIQTHQLPAPAAKARSKSDTR